MIDTTVFLGVGMFTATVLSLVLVIFVCALSACELG